MPDPTTDPVLNAGEFILPLDAIAPVSINGKFEGPDAHGDVVLHIKVIMKPLMTSTKDGTPIPKELFDVAAVFETTKEQCQTGFPVLTYAPQDPTDVENTK